MDKLTVTKDDEVAKVIINNSPANILKIELINEVNAFVLSLKGDRDKPPTFRECSPIPRQNLQNKQVRSSGT